MRRLSLAVPGMGCVHSQAHHGQKERSLEGQEWKSCGMSMKVASLPETPHIRQWRRFELICQAITAYKDYIMALCKGAQYHFTEDIWPVGGGEMNAII